MNLVYECEIMLDICDKSNVVLYLDKYTGDVNVWNWFFLNKEFLTRFWFNIYIWINL